MEATSLKGKSLETGMSWRTATLALLVACLALGGYLLSVRKDLADTKKDLQSEKHYSRQIQNTACDYLHGLRKAANTDTDAAAKVLLVESNLDCVIRP